MKYHRHLITIKELSTFTELFSCPKAQKIIFNVLIHLLLIQFIQIIAAGCAEAKGTFYYSIHSASYRNLDEVRRSISSLKDKGYDAFFEKVDILGKGHWYRVFVGKYGSKEMAAKDAINLKQANVVDDVRVQGFFSPMVPAVATMKKRVKSEGTKLDDSLLQDRSSKRTGKNISPNIKLNGKGLAEQMAKDVIEKTDVEQTLSTPPVFFTGQEEKPSSPIIDSALRAMSAGKYDQALELLKAVLIERSTDGTTREQASRLAADCFYFKGGNGSSQPLLMAVEQYKAVLQHYPDPARGNDAVYYRMASGYERLKFYYEAIAALDRLIVTYPESGFLQDAMFRIGELFRQTGKYNRAIERLIAYLNKFPNGKYARLSQLALGDSYYRVKRSDFAIKWYGEAWRKWPDLHDLPRETLLNMGNSYFESEKFAEAFQIFSQYLNLYPTDEFSRICLYKMAQGAAAMGDISLALKLYSLIIERYPSEKIAEESSLAMANLGVYGPGLKLPAYLTEINDYLEPLKTYGKLLAKYPSGDQAANIMSLRGSAFGKYGRIKDAFATYVELINKFPRSRYTDEGRKKLKSYTATLVNGYFVKGNYLDISDIYFQCFEKKILPLDDFDMALMLGESLQKTGLYDEAARVYEAQKGSYKDQEKENRIALALAKIDFAKGRYDNAESTLILLLKPSIRDRKLQSDIKLTLADLYYKKGLFEKAVPIYADILRGAGDQEEVGVAYRNYGRSLQATNMTHAAIANYLTALKDYEEHPKKYQAEIIADIYVGLGDAYLSEHKYGEGIAMYRKALPYASDGDGKKWLISGIGKGYAGLDDSSAAEKNFAQLKEPAEGEFWPKVADYFIGNSKPLAKTGKLK